VFSIRHSLLAAGVAGAAALALVPGAGAADPAEPTVCDGTLSDVVIRGDVFVPYGTDCTLKNVVVRGGLTAELDARSVTLDRTAVTGDVVTESQRIVLRAAAVNGSVTATEARSGLSITRSVVRGDLSTANVETSFTIGSATDATQGNVVGGTLSVRNTFADGVIGRNAVAGDLALRRSGAGITVRRNIVGGALDCVDNDPAPIGGGNLAATKTGQCAAL
jgi:hypothetical protein